MPAPDDRSWAVPDTRAGHPPPAAPAAVPTPLPAPGDPPTTPECRPAPGLPQRAGRYELHEEIGRGGMGVVARATDPNFHRTLAVKILIADPAGRPDLERRFREEARLTAQLQHPGVPPRPR